jgi:membrane protease subunit HflK
MKKAIAATIVAGMGLAVVLAAASGWCMVAPGEVVVVRRFGRLVEPPWGPGLHWSWPLGIDRLDRVRSDAVRQVTVGPAGQSGPAGEPSSGEATTGDLNLLRVHATIQYRVSRAADYVLKAQQVEPLLRMAAGASVARALASRGVDAVLRTDRQAIARDAERQLQALADGYELGVTILGVSLTDARPPSEVEADFTAAQSAESERDRRINEAQSYHETTVVAARSAAGAKLEVARAGAMRRLVTARAEADRFAVLAAQVERSRGLTIRRLYIDSMQSLLARVKTKLILPSGGELDLTLLGIKAVGPPPAAGSLRADQNQSATPSKTEVNHGSRETNE